MPIKTWNQNWSLLLLFFFDICSVCPVWRFSGLPITIRKGVRPVFRPLAALMFPVCTTLRNCGKRSTHHAYLSYPLTPLTLLTPTFSRISLWAKIHWSQAFWQRSCFLTLQELDSITSVKSEEFQLNTVENTLKCCFAQCNSISSTLSFPAFICIHLMEERHSFHDNGVVCHMRLLWWWSVVNPPPDDCSPLRSISIKWSRCENWPVKGLLHQQVVLNSWWIPRAICRRRGNVPDCDLLMVWRLFAWICLMADFSRAEPSAGGWLRGYGCADMHTCNHTLLRNHTWILLHLLLATCHSSNQSTTELAFVNSVTRTSLKISSRNQIRTTRRGIWYQTVSFPVVD